jgi:glycosyltransferase EpsE
VTVVTTLVTRAEELSATLDSLLDSRMRDFELVLVADSQDAGARRAGRQWLVDHPRLASRLITAGAPLRLGAARNIALEFARGGYSLFLDPGQELYSRCLEVLAGTLDAMPDDIAFVYPIQEVVGEVDAFAEAGGDFLMSYFGWDPGRLRAGNYVHAPALVRRERLREIGGFSTDARLAGLEEYDLWCRMAERGWRGQLVSQELARRTESGSSIVLSALNPQPGIAMQTLIGRAPELMASAVAPV